MKFVKRFKTEQEYNNYFGSDKFILPNVSLVDELSDSENSIKFNPLPQSNPSYNGYEYVDLGLPSGLKWARCNIGAEKESDYGLYFQWGDVVGYKDANSGKSFSWSEYKYFNWSSKRLTKYNSKGSYGIIDNLTTLEPGDDAATVNMGGSWRMPSNEEYQELKNNTTNTLTTVNGVNGTLFTSKTNGNTLFFPASGYCNGNSVYFSGEVGYYWSSSLSSRDSNSACNFRSNDVDYHGRNFGHMVRGVIE